MLRKIILSTILATIFFCGQCFAASEYPICSKDQNAFIASFNTAAKNLGFTLGTPESLPMENNPDNVNVYSVEPVPGNVHAGSFVITDKDNFVNRILLVTDDVEIATKMFKPALLAVGLTENEINVNPTFDTTAMLNSFWCEATKRYVNVVTAINKDNSDVVYILILASQDKPKK